jgi:hypothetical protein
MTKTQGWFLVLGLLFIAVIGVVTVLILLNRVISPLESVAGLPDRIATQAAELMHPTPTIYPDPVTVIQQVRSLARLETVQYTVQKIITAESGQGPFGFLFGDRLLLVAHGSVIAGIDLAKLQYGDIRIDTGNGTITVILPPAEIFVYTLDNEKTEVYSRETSLFAPKKDLETLARQAAEKEILDAALKDGILDVALTNGQAYLERFLISLGLKRVVFMTATPIPTLLSTP